MRVRGGGLRGQVMYHRYVVHCFDHDSYFALGLFYGVERFTSLLSAESIVEHFIEQKRDRV